jgi:hypothetical protein
MKKNEHILTTADMQGFIQAGMEPEFLSLARLIQLAAEKGAMAYYHRNKSGSVQSHNALYELCNSRYRLSDAQLAELTTFMLDGHLPFQMAARLGYQNCEK